MVVCKLLGHTVNIGSSVRFFCNNLTLDTTRSGMVNIFMCKCQKFTNKIYQNCNEQAFIWIDAPAYYAYVKHWLMEYAFV